MIEEILPGVLHWTAHHEGIDSTVHSSFVVGSGTLIDPMLPEEGIDEIEAFARPRQIVLSNRHHYRQSAHFARRFRCPVLCHEAGLHEFVPSQQVEGFAFGEQLAEDVQALELASICPEETTLLLELPDGGALSFADGLTRGRDGSLAFMPDWLLGEDPETVRAGLREHLRPMLQLDFDALLFAHAAPVRSAGKAMLSELLAE
ncbi:MAG TPA: hypothetical protein VGF95_06175 [Solirubrobacteraceae bacterium]|jgi:hypothetical protein